VWSLGAIVGCGGGSQNADVQHASVETISVPGPGRDTYETTAEAGGVRAESAAEQVSSGVRDAGQDAGILLQGDERLALLAEWIVPHLGQGGAAPPHEVIELCARHLGLVEPVPHLLVLGQSSDNGLDVAVADGVRRFLARQRYTHFGAAVVLQGDLRVVVVTLSTRVLTLDSVPRALDAGTRAITLRGRLSDGYTTPTVAVAPPGADVERLPAGPGPDFAVEVPLAGPGAYQVEVLARGSRGDSVVANFPVYVGVDPPREVAIRVRDDASEMSDAAAVARALLARINESREGAGLRPLSAHDGLDDVARAHSEDMVANGFVGHRSPTTGDAPARVERAGYRSGLILENIGRGYSPTEIHQGLLASPGHRANILNRSVTHVGVGVVAETEGSRTAFVATEVFIRMNAEIDAAEARAELLDAINAGRRARGASALDVDENLETAAGNAATEYFANPNQSQQDTVDDASGSLRRFAMMFSRIGGLMAVVGDVSEASRLEPTFDPEVRYIGIGVAQGDRPDAPPNSIGVVILLGWAR
jgi:uncharacterized protein YkwD